ncbi:MAG: hypothetical protein ABMA26_09365 [Limisphaerales bacterium]
MKHILALLFVTALLHASVACKRKPATSPETSGASETTTTAPATSTGKSDSTEPSAPAIAQAKPGASENSPLNGELTDAVARFRDKHKRLPTSWQELVQTGFLKSLPKPPPGVRYAIDPISAMVVEVK